MNRNRTLDVLRITAALAVWFTVYKLYGVFADPLLEGVLPVTLRMILSSMVVPYTVALGAFYLVAAGMPVTHFEGTRKIGIGGILKFFVIQTGLSFPPMIAVNVVFRILNIGMTGLTSDEMFGNLWFYIVLLLIFNPVFEELLFRKLILERLGCLGEKGAVICSAVLFALPHVISQGVAQMFYTFALGLVWGYVTVRTGRIWPAVILHSLSNIYGAYIPMLLSGVSPILSVLFVMFTMVVMVPLTIIFLTARKKRAE